MRMHVLALFHLSYMTLLYQNVWVAARVLLTSKNGLRVACEVIRLPTCRR